MKLDLNAFRRPSLDLTLCDEAQTEVRVIAPNEGMIRELSDVVPVLQDAAENPTPEAMAVLYDLAARLMGHNLSGFSCTADELRTVYGLDIELLAGFFSAYYDFILDLGKNTPSRTTSELLKK